jgi:hypothetical protein
MNFIARQRGNVYNRSTSIIIQDGEETIFNIELPDQENTIAGWRTCFTYLHNTNPDELNDLFAAIPHLLKTEVDEDAHPTYSLILRALFEWTGQAHTLPAETFTVYNLQMLLDLHKQLEQALFHFTVATPNSEFYEAVFTQANEEPLRIRIPRDKFDKAPIQVSQAVLTLAYERQPEPIGHFISDYIHFQAHITNDNSKTFEIFICISKALIKLIKQETTSLGMYISQVPDICTFIVKNERDGEEQKAYLEHILSSLERIEQRLARLDTIVTGIKDEISQSKVENTNQQRENEYRRLMHVISVISDHYLKYYDLERSATFWEKANSKDPLLWFFLALHRWPIFFVLGQILLLGLPSFYAFQHWLCQQSCPPQANGPLLLKASDPAFIVMLLWYALILLLLSLILVQTLRKRWLYSQLLLPRVLGAAIVGLLPLVLNDQSWLIGIQNNAINWSLLVLFTYAGSFVYMFIEVFNTLKFVQGRSMMTEVLRVSGHIFGIAFTETLFIVAITSTLILPAILPSLNIKQDKFGIYINLVPWLSFGFFPSLILLWTGIALFIGSFVQLIWQGQRITESI